MQVANSPHMLRCFLGVERLSGGLPFAVRAGRRAGQLKEDIVKRRPTQTHVADPDSCATKLGGSLLDEDEAVARRRQGQPVRPFILLRSAAADAKKRSLSRVTL